MKKWKKVRTKSTHQFGKYYSVDVDQVITPGGKEGEYSVIRMKPFSIIVPIDKDGMVYFVKQHRYTTDQITIELPMGSTDGEDPLVAAKRELEEETGLVSDDWASLGEIHSAIGIAGIVGFVYLAKKVRTIDNPRVDPQDKDLIEVVKYPAKDVKKMIADGVINDSAAISALTKAIFSNNL